MPYIIPRGHFCDIIVLNIHAPTEDTIYDVKYSFHEEQECIFYTFSKYHVKSLLRDFIPKVDKEDISIYSVDKNLLEISNDNGVRVVNFATSKNFTVKSTMFPFRNIHKFTLTSPDVKPHTQIEYIQTDRLQHSSVLDVRPYRAADCDTDHCLVVAKVRERLAVNKQRSHRFHMERFNHKKLNEAEGKEKYLVEISHRFAALEDININSA
jgi:hypothetical protein